MKKITPKVYVAMTADLLHSGHINILKAANQLGEVVVGLYTYDACRELNDLPYLSYEKRENVLNSICYINKVIPQFEASYKRNLVKLKPAYVVHGDDWRYNFHKKYRDEVINLLKKWNGKLIEVKYSKDIDNLKIKDEIQKKGIDFISRLSSLRNLLHAKKTLKIIEVHSPLCGLIADNVFLKINDKKIEFDGMWSSSLTDSTVKGKPDTESVDISSRLDSVNQIFEVAKKPLLFDGDTGGSIDHFKFTVRSLERLGVSAIVIEDKKGLKRNSLFENSVYQKQETISNFCKKISLGKSAQRSNEFMIIARVESLVLGKSVQDALKRALAYIKAGADGIFIHPKSNQFSQLKKFIKGLRKKNKKTILIVAPSTYNKVKLGVFEKLNVNIVIYANHLLRSSYPAMSKVAKSILANQRSFEADKHCMSINQILELIPETKS
jgi:phosphoenolpyruvate phosphomutase